MNISSGIKDYCMSHFEYKELTRILGKSTTDALIIIFKQLKRNAQKFTTTLGGGLLGYLALVLDTPIFMAIPNVSAFVRPTHPGAFIAEGRNLILTGIAEQKAQHDENLRLYFECIAVEIALRD